MKESFTLRHWALLIILMPTIAVGLLLGGHLTIKRFSELDENLTDRGMYLTEPLALLSAEKMAQGDKKPLSSILDKAHRKASPMVRSITIFLPDHQVYLSTNLHSELNKLRLEPGRLLPEASRYQAEENFIYVRTPIVGPNGNKRLPSYIVDGDHTTFGYIVVELSRDHALLGQQSSLFSIIAIIVAAILFSTLFAIRFINNVTLPLQKLKTATSNILKGDHKTKVVLPMMGELNILRDDINQLAKALYKANEKAEHNISEYTNELQQTVEQLEVQNIELSMARKEALEANDVKSQFLANMSHELRTPLNGVLGFARQLKKTSLNPNQRDFVETIESSGQNLMRIINDILDFSKLEVGKMELENMPFSLRDLVNDVMTLLAPNVFDKGLDIFVSVDAAVPNDLNGDPDRIKQILINLIGNAIKFTSNGFVRLDISYIGSSPDGQHIKFVVADTGVGIDKDGQNKLFEAFGQADTSITRKFGGTGLGLIICKRLIEAMGGDIGLESEKGKGSKFFFDVFIPESSVSTGASLASSSLAYKKLLYLDTCGQSLADVNNLLQEHTELNVTTCDNEEVFATKLKQQIFDIVLISRHVTPSSVGELKQLTQLAKQHVEHVYAMINSISPNMRESIIGSGASACLSLPANHRKLINALAQPYFSERYEPTSQVPKFSGIKVLAVDDNQANLKLLTTLLAEMAITTELANDGQQALSLAQKYSYDVIFMDIQMPIMDGITACTEIKESSLNEETPIIAVTAHAAPEEQQKMETSGFSGYLAKPIDEEMLKQILLEVDPQPTLHKETSPEPENISFDFQELPIWAEHPHVDWKMALNRAAGKTDLAIEMLVMLVNSLPSTIEDINRCSEERDLTKLLEVIHKFHGACCYTGLPKLKKLAETIENGLKMDSELNQLEPEIFELVDELNGLNHDSAKWGLRN